MNHPNFVRMESSDQAVSARPLAVVDKPQLSAEHLSAVDPDLLERVKGIFNNSRMFSNPRQVCGPSFTHRMSSSVPRLLDPASFARGRLSDFHESVFDKEQIIRSAPEVHYTASKHATRDTRPGEQLPAAEPAYVTGKKLDGWLPAPSGLRRKGIAERVTGQNLPPAFNEREDKSTSEVFPSNNLYQTGFNVKGRESEWAPMVQWLKPYSVNDSHGRGSEDQRLAHQNIDEAAGASNSMQEAVKQVMSNLKDAEMADPEADAALFETLSRGEKKQVVEIQQMTGIQCITAIVTALRTLWEFEPKVVRTLGNLEPEEIQQLGDDD